MPNKNPMRQLRDCLRRFRAANNGNVVLTFALLLFPIVGAMGAAVDYSRGNSDKAAMQAAVDATALMLSKEVSTLTPSQTAKKATAYFKAVFNRTGVNNIKVTPTYTTSDGSKLVVAGTGTVPTSFMRVVGINQMNIDVSSTIRWGITRLRVALVLDNTGSMASAGKMTALKTAAKSFLTQMQSTAGANGDVYVSIIPFAREVNAGKTNYSASWVDFTDHDKDDGWDSNNGKCQGANILDQDLCEKAKLTWTPASHDTWNGCVTDRDQNYDTTNAAPTPANQKTLFPAYQSNDCPVELMPLSYDWSALKNKINSMQPAGNTNQTIGLQWGFQSLTSAPFAIPPLAPNYKYNQIVILLTDGLNTDNRFVKLDPSLDTPQKKQKAIDARTSKACDNIKAAQITLYTVQVNTGGDPTSAMLKACASTPDKFFLLTSSSSIVSTLGQIATEISVRRIAQ